jgi:hypothetical protein
VLSLRAAIQVNRPCSGFPLHQNSTLKHGDRLCEQAAQI